MKVKIVFIIFSKYAVYGQWVLNMCIFSVQDLPDTIHIGGRILPQTVWEYVDLIKTSEAKVRP